MSNYRLSGYRRRIMARLVEVMGPTWPDFTADIKQDVLDDIEGLIRGYPPFIRFGITMMLWLTEFGGPPTFTGLRPFTLLTDADAAKRLDRMLHHRIPGVRNIPKFLKIIISIAAYGRPEVEAFLEVPRRRWRAQRVEFRAALVQIDQTRDRPAVPQALGSQPHATARAYLDFQDDPSRVASVETRDPEVNTS